MRKARIALAGEVVIPTLLVADRFWERMWGLLGRSNLPNGTAMLLKPCRAIHTVGMRFPLDLVFVDRDLVVTGTAANVCSGKYVVGKRGTWATIEMETGWFDLPKLDVGTALEILI